MAAIGCSESAQKYGLKVLKEGIQDYAMNYTRFVVLGKRRPAPTGHDKTSLAVYLERDRPGALYEFLGEFARRSINMTRIESRHRKSCWATTGSSSTWRDTPKTLYYGKLYLP
jgi:prephenate dehydratase